MRTTKFPNLKSASFGSCYDLTIKNGLYQRYGDSRIPTSLTPSKVLGFCGTGLVYALHCFLQKIMIWDSVSTDVEVNASMPGRNYILFATLHEQSPWLCWILSWFFYLSQKSSEICARPQIVLIACLGVGIRSDIVGHSLNLWYMLDFYPFYLINNYSS